MSAALAVRAPPAELQRLARLHGWRRVDRGGATDFAAFVASSNLEIHFSAPPGGAAAEESTAESAWQATSFTIAAGDVHAISVDLLAGGGWAWHAEGVGWGGAAPPRPAADLQLRGAMALQARALVAAAEACLPPA